MTRIFNQITSHGVQKVWTLFFLDIPFPLYIFFKAPTFGNTFFDNIDIKLFFYVSKTIEPRYVLSLWATLLYTTPCGELIHMKDFPRKQHYYYKIYTSLMKSAFAPCSIDNLPIFKRKWSRQKNASIISLEWKIILPKGNNYVEWKYDAESWFLPHSTKDLRTANLTFRENIDKRWVAFKTLIDCYNEYSVICSFLKFIQLDTSIFFLVSHIPTQFVYNCSVLFIQFAVLYFIC